MYGCIKVMHGRGLGEANEEACQRANNFRGLVYSNAKYCILFFPIKHDLFSHCSFKVLESDPEQFIFDTV